MARDSILRANSRGTAGLCDEAEEKERDDFGAVGEFRALWCMICGVVLVSGRMYSLALTGLTTCM
jgi:hypothetical protein